MNQYQTLQELDKRMDRIENKLDMIANNHLGHVEKYTKWTLVGIVVSISLSVVAMFLTL